MPGALIVTALAIVVHHPFTHLAVMGILVARLAIVCCILEVVCLLFGGCLLVVMAGIYSVYRSQQKSYVVREQVTVIGGMILFAYDRYGRGRRDL